jgi:hypothetical protein
MLHAFEGKAESVQHSHDPETGDTVTELLLQIDERTTVHVSIDGDVDIQDRDRIEIEGSIENFFGGMVKLMEQDKNSRAPIRLNLEAISLRNRSRQVEWSRFP